MSLYKYVIAERIDVLKNGSIRFSQASALNDPIEVSPVFRDITNIIPLIDDELYSGQRIEINSTMLGAAMAPYSVNLGEGYEERKRFEVYMGALVKRISQAFGESLGVLSLTEKPDNLLMWAHYAQQHQGFVIQFDETHGFFRQQDQDNPDLGRLLKVTYSNDRPLRASMLELTTQELFLSKGRDWEYEQEWRVLRLLTDSHVKISTPAGVVHLFSIPPDCVSGLILGCRMSLQHREEIRAFLTNDERYRNIELYQAEVDSEAYRLNIRPYDRESELDNQNLIIRID